MKCDILELQADMKKKLKHKRYIHSVGVMYTAANLAMRYDVPMYKAGVAGILHDCAKEMGNEELIRYCQKNNIELSDDELCNPALIHSKAGAQIAKDRYDIDDEDIINAIRFHTTGKPGMTRLEQIIFVADYIEPNRKVVPGLDLIRQKAYIDIDITCMMIFENTINYLKNEEKHIDRVSLEAYEYYNSVTDIILRG